LLGMGMAQKAREGFADLTVVLPTYNEVENIQRIVPEVFRLCPGAHVVVVDDSSQDGTGAAVSEMMASYPRLRLIERDISKKGLTASVMEGIASVETEFFVVMDADFQHPPASVENFYWEMRQGADLVVGVRHGMGPLRFSRKVASWGAHKLASTYLWFRRLPRSADLMSGFFGGRTEMVREVIQRKGMRFEKKGFKVLFDILKSCPRGTDVREVGFTFGDRASGHSKLSSDIVLSVMRQCGAFGKLASFSFEFFFINRAGRVLGLLILVAIFAVALMMGNSPAKP